MSSDAGLYGIRKPKNTPKEISSSTSLAFASSLSSLLANSSKSQRPGRPRPSKDKEDIFKSHNKNTKKRAAKDLDDDSYTQVHKKDIGAVDESVLHRSKRKMEEKAKKYSAMKRGEILDGSHERDQLIDFDTKWAEEEKSGKQHDGSSDNESDDGQHEMVDYEDEYGRARRGTRAEAERMERRKRNKVIGAEELDRMSARPTMPKNVIYGDTVQVDAFNPDEPIAKQMEELAKKRDRSVTPPEQKHYEADKEFRIKGVGFYSFSKDEKIREKEMEALERERLETERMRMEREGRKEQRKREIEERRKAIGEKRAKKQADSFLEGLTADLDSPNG